MPETRKLSTIVFADIEGYTSLMQSDEEKAMQFLNSFKTELEKIVPSFDGEIVQYFGDACLLSFDSTSQSVRCAMALQSSFQQSGIPIRIGLHLGEVIFTENNVFGDGVNVASRIESMGVPGGILVSKPVKDQIGNKLEFQLESLGTFEFKNVEEPLEVFAIANDGFVIPKREEMSGKFKFPIPKRQKKWKILIIILFFLSLLAFWFLRPNTSLLTNDQIKSQLAILPFENETGLNDLEQFGTMISDWLTSRLMETGETKILSATYLQNQVLQASLMPESINKLYSSSGIGVIISGRYYLQGDDLYIQVNIIDTQTGQIIHAPDPIVKPRSELEVILHELIQNILGYWEVRDLRRFQKKPPRYEAYQAYLSGLDDFNNQLESAEFHLKRAYELDTTFFSPLLKLSPFYRNRGRLNAKDSLFTMLATKQSSFSQWELNYYKFIRARTDGRWYEAAKFAEEATQMDPSHFTFFSRAAHAYQNANYHQKAIDVMLKVDTSLISQASKENIHQWIDYSLFMLGKVEEVYSRYEKYMSEGPLKPWERPLYVEVLIKTGRTDEILDFVLNTSNTGLYNKGILLYRICNSLLVTKEDNLARHYAQVLKDFTLNNPDRPDHLLLMGESEMFLQNWNQAINHFEKYIEDKGLLNISNFRSSQLSVYGDLAACYAHVGNLSRANQLLEGFSRHTFYERFGLYYKARVLAINLDHNKAIEALALAIQSGYVFNNYSYAFDHHLVPLFDNPRFQKLVSVKG